MPAIESLVVSLLNRLLEYEAWPRQRLLPYSGQTATIEGGPLHIALTVDDGGLFSLASPGCPSDVTISFGTDAPFKLLADPASVFTSARLTGAASFAEALGFVFRNLRWDYEGDIAGIIGDIPARRMARFFADGIAWHRSALGRLGANLKEYATDESALLTSGRDITQFCDAVDLLRDDLARLEKRLALLNH